jgi:hypothetical protein
VCLQGVLLQIGNPAPLPEGLQLQEAEDVAGGEGILLIGQLVEDEVEGSGDLAAQVGALQLLPGEEEGRRAQVTPPGLQQVEEASGDLGPGGKVRGTL